MSTPTTATEHAFASLRTLLADGGTAPWWRPEVVGAGLPRKGHSLGLYTGANALMLWIGAAAGGRKGGLWYTEAAAKRRGGRLREGAEPVAIRGTRVYAWSDFQGLPAPPKPAPVEVAVRRVADLVRFSGASVDGQVPTTRQQAADTLPRLVRWTGAADRLDRPDQGMEWLVDDLGAAFVAAWLGLPVAPTGGRARTVRLVAMLRDFPEVLLDAADDAWVALCYLQDLAHPDLLAEIRAAARGQDHRVGLGGGLPPEDASSLGEMLVVDEGALWASRDEVGEEPQRLVLGDSPARALLSFIDDVGGFDPDSRRRPPASAWVTGGPGTGATQVVDALENLLLTGGIDLSTSWLDSEGSKGRILEAIGRVWEAPHVEVVPCELPGRFAARHDRAIPTACLTAFHASRGLSPRLWMARLEHRLHRSDEHAAFAAAFEEEAGRPWVGEGAQSPERYAAHIAKALGTGGRRRVDWYERTRTTASWRALFDEVDWTMHARPLGEPGPGQERRVLFVLDLSSAEGDLDPAAVGWLGRALAPLPPLLRDLETKGERPYWFLFCARSDLRRLAGIARWERGKGEVKHHVDLERHPVTSPFTQATLKTRPLASRPIYRLYARQRAALEHLGTLEDWTTPPTTARDGFLASFPFLPPVLPVAQAVIDALVSDPAIEESRPLSNLVEQTLAEHYHAPPERFVPLDVLLEPIIHQLQADDARHGVAKARAIIPRAGPVAHSATFPQDTVLQVLRLVGRIPGFPASARNLASLMFVRFEHPVDHLVAEVQATLERLCDLRLAKRTSDGTHYRWERPL